MKSPLHLLALCIALLPLPLLPSPTALTAQTSPTALEGAWESTFPLPDGSQGTLQLIVADGFLAMTSYADTAFISTLGGSYVADDKTLTLRYEFNSGEPERIGGTQSMRYEVQNDLLVFNGSKVWTRVDDGNGPGALQGAWLITGRKRNGEMTRRETDGPRKTMKILSGSRFQWIAYNTQSREFLGTGGGRYTTEANDGLYIEYIDFFSRDNARVGDQLSFDYKIRNGEWHHSGLSSKGKPIYETWGRR